MIIVLKLNVSLKNKHHYYSTYVNGENIQYIGVEGDDYLADFKGKEFTKN